MWNLLTAADYIFKSGPSPIVPGGMDGLPVLLRPGEPLRLSDIELMAVPDLSSRGVKAELSVLAEADAFASLLHSRDHPCMLFQLSEQPQKPPLFSDSPLEDRSEQPLFIDPEVVGCSLLRHSGTHVEIMSAVETEWVDFTPVNAPFALLNLRRSKHTGRRFAHVSTTLLRWSAFAAAYPERVIASQDGEQCESAARLLLEWAGARRSPATTRLRRACKSFSEHDPAAGFNWLCWAALLRIGVSVEVVVAMMQPEDRPLSGVQRRELIYLLRAGSPEMRVLAAGRLRSEQAHRDVRSSLYQMRYNENAWVRAATAI